MLLSKILLSIFPTIKQAKFHLSSTITYEVKLFGYVIYSYCVSTGEETTWPNKLTLPIMELERWKLARVIVEKMMNTLVLVKWRILSIYLTHGAVFFEMELFAAYITMKTSISQNSRTGNNMMMK